jgi:hypothetical protein
VISIGRPRCKSGHPHLSRCARETPRCPKRGIPRPKCRPERTPARGSRHDQPPPLFRPSTQLRKGAQHVPCSRRVQTPVGTRSGHRRRARARGALPQPRARARARATTFTRSLQQLPATYPVRRRLYKVARANPSTHAACGAPRAARARGAELQCTTRDDPLPRNAPRTSLFPGLSPA